MTRLASVFRLELTLQVRQKFLHAGVFSGLIWLAVLLPLPHRLRPVFEPYILLGDVAIVGFFFIGGSVFFEKQERTVGAIISTPLRFWEYLTPKVALLTGLSLSVAVVVVSVAHGLDYRPIPMIVGVILGTVLMLLVGFITCLPFSSVGDWVIFGTVPLAVMTGLPVLSLSGVWATPVLYAIPTLGPLLLLGDAFGQLTLTPWQAVYAVGYPLVSIAVMCTAAKFFFGKYVVARSGT